MTQIKAKPTRRRSCSKSTASCSSPWLQTRYHALSMRAGFYVPKPTGRLLCGTYPRQ